MVTEPIVWLNPYQPPVTLLERRVYSVLAGGPLYLRDVVERLAEAAVYEHYAHGVWSLEVGAQALPVLRQEARSALLALDGGQIAIETSPQVRAAANALWELQVSV
jgi:hypothetical protein